MKGICEGQACKCPGTCLVCRCLPCIDLSVEHLSLRQEGSLFLVSVEMNVLHLKPHCSSTALPSIISPNHVLRPHVSPPPSLTLCALPAFPSGPCFPSGSVAPPGVADPSLICGVSLSGQPCGTNKTQLRLGQFFSRMLRASALDEPGAPYESSPR